jgi:hypothetical protein
MHLLNSHSWRLSGISIPRPSFFLLDSSSLCPTTGASSRCRPSNQASSCEWSEQETRRPFHLLYHADCGTWSCALRPTITNGSGLRVKDARQTLLGIWLRSLLPNQPIQVFGDGEQLRDFNDVKDVVDVPIRSAETPSCYGKVLSLGSPEIVSLRWLAEELTSTCAASRWGLMPFPPDRK